SSAIFEQYGHGLGVPIGPAVSLKSFTVEDDQSLRTGADEKFGIEDGDRGQIALRKAVERRIAPLCLPLFVELGQSAVRRGKDRAVELRQTAGGATALNQRHSAAGESPKRILLERRERPRFRQRAGRLEFTIGAAFGDNAGDQNGDCDHRRERYQI